MVGQRTLLIEGIDLDQNPLTGYRAVDLKLIEIRNELRTSPRISPSDLDSLRKVFIALASLAARAVHDRLFKDVSSE